MKRTLRFATVESEFLVRSWSMVAASQKLGGENFPELPPNSALALPAVRDGRFKRPKRVDQFASARDSVRLIAVRTIAIVDCVFGP